MALGFCKAYDEPYPYSFKPVDVFYLDRDLVSRRLKIQALNADK